jgi:hypothetical protein
LLLILLLLTGCGAQPAAAPISDSPSPAATSSARPAPAAPAQPAWEVGKTPLPLGKDGFGQVLPTPPELVNRSLPTKDTLPPPGDGAYASSAAPARALPST